MKKYITLVSFTKISVFVFILFSTLVTAQTDLPDAPEDTTPAPIDDYVWVLALVGLIFVLLRFKALVKQANTSIK
jgi:hypothetical protein